MKATEQVCSLKLAKKLKELGVKQESLFVWHLDGILRIAADPEERVGHMLVPKDPIEISDIALKEICSAFTVSELGEMLPTHIYFKEKKNIPNNSDTRRMKETKEGQKRLEKMRSCGLLSFAKPNGWFAYYTGYAILDYPNFVHAGHLSKSKTEADSRARMLIYLLENKLINI